MTKRKTDDQPATGALTEVALDFIRSMPIPAFLIDDEKNTYLANQAMAEAFGYESIKALEKRIRQPDFVAAHFQPEAVAQLYDTLLDREQVESWPVKVRAVDGREFNFEAKVRGRLRSPLEPPSYLAVVFLTAGRSRDAESFLTEARKEAELASRAKTEFLSNISHELRTPLHIIIGMLGLTADDDSISENVRRNLAMAKEAADGLAAFINDLIMLSDLEAGRLASDISPFSPALLLKSLAQRFAAQAAGKNIRLTVSEDEKSSKIVEGGYNLIELAMAKLVDNAIKFTEAGGKVIISATLENGDDGLGLMCRVLDNGPGIAAGILESKALFVQGDGSKSRKHCGLGLGFSITSNIFSKLGSRLHHAAPPGGGADLSFRVPVKQHETEG